MRSFVRSLVALALYLVAMVPTATATRQAPGGTQTGAFCKRRPETSPYDGPGAADELGRNGNAGACARHTRGMYPQTYGPDGQLPIRDDGEFIDVVAGCELVQGRDLIGSLQGHVIGLSGRAYPWPGDPDEYYLVDPRTGIPILRATCCNPYGSAARLGIEENNLPDRRPLPRDVGEEIELGVGNDNVNRNHSDLGPAPRRLGGSRPSDLRDDIPLTLDLGDGNVQTLPIARDARTITLRITNSNTNVNINDVSAGGGRAASRPALPSCERPRGNCRQDCDRGCSPRRASGIGRELLGLGLRVAADHVGGRSRPGARPPRPPWCFDCNGRNPSCPHRRR